MSRAIEGQSSSVWISQIICPSHARIAM